MVKNREKNFVSAVVYIHNNESEIKGFIETLIQVFGENFEKFEIVCVNDFSTDGSMRHLLDLANQENCPIISIVNMSYYQGIELSMNAGVDLAIGDFVFEFDGMLMDYPLHTIMDVYYHSLSGFDIVSAVPKGNSRSTSKIYYKIYNYFSDSKYKLQTEAFRVLSRRAINRIHAMSITVPYRKAVYANCGLKLDWIEFTSPPKSLPSESKQIYRVKKAIAIDSLILFTDVAHQIALGMTFLMMLVTVSMGGYSLYIFLGQRTPVEGWTTTILFMAVAFFGIFAVLAMVIKYLSILIDLVFKKQKYIIESIQKL